MKLNLQVPEDPATAYEMALQECADAVAQNALSEQPVCSDIFYYSKPVSGTTSSCYCMGLGRTCTVEAADETKYSSTVYQIRASIAFPGGAASGKAKQDFHDLFKKPINDRKASTLKGKYLLKYHPDKNGATDQATKDMYEAVYKFLTDIQEEYTVCKEGGQC